MVITKKRIFSIEKYLGFLDNAQEVYVTCAHTKTPEEIEGELYIPTPCGPVTEFNRDGKFQVLKDEDKEPREIEHDYHVVDWHGNDHYGSCFQTRMCYPKKYIAPPLETVVIENGFVRSSVVTKSETDRLLHIVNMFLEIYGTCEIVDVNLKPVCRNNVKRLQWKILPPGKYPWDVAKERLRETFKNDKNQSGDKIESHHRTIARHIPEFMAIGEDGFYGYVVYGYPGKNLYVFESNQIDNATYIFNGKWEDLSKLTKRELIQGHLFAHRLIHTSDWRNKIEDILK